MLTTENSWFENYAAYHVRTTPKSYSSTGKLWMSGKLDIKEGQLYMEELSSFIGTQVELLKSSTIYQRALTNTLAANPTWSSLSTNISPDEPGPFKVTVTDFPKTAVIEVKAVGEEPAAVREFVNSLMEEYQGFRKSVRQQKSDVSITSITEQVKLLELDVRKQQERLQNFLGSNNVVLLQEQGSSAGAFVARLSKQLASLRTELKLLALITPEQLTQAGGKSRNAPDEESVFGQGTANDLMTTLAGPQADFFRASQQVQLFEAKREELLEFLLPSHPKILKLDENIAEQKKILEVFKRQSLAQMGNRREALGLQITNIEASAGEWETKALDASRKMADYDRIRQDVARTQALIREAPWRYPAGGCQPHPRPGECPCHGRRLEAQTRSPYRGLPRPGHRRRPLPRPRSALRRQPLRRPLRFPRRTQLPDSRNRDRPNPEHPHLPPPP